MKMTIGAELPEDYEPAHADLASAANTLIAHSLLPMFQDAMGEQLAKANVEGIMTELAFALDEGEITIGGKTYRPRLAFVDDAGQVVPGAADMDNFNELVSEPFDIDPEAKVSFEQDEFEGES
ncbi:MAG: hypothetical protein AAF700_08875 [Pseudomonadota bacterium]